MKVNRRKEILAEIIKERPDATLVKNKYKVLAGMIKRMYPIAYANIGKDKWEDIIFEVVNGDRDWRLATHGLDEVEKERLRQEWILRNLAD